MNTSLPKCPLQRPPRRRALLFTGLLLPVLAIRASGDSLLQPGNAAPGFELLSLTEQTVRASDLKGRVVLLLFGELYNANSVAASQDVATVLSRMAPTGAPAAAFLLVAQRSPAPELAAEAGRRGVTLPILHDPERRAFLAYNVSVLPSLVVIDSQGRIVLPCAGYPLDFQDLVSDTLALAAGQLSEAEYRGRRAGAELPVGSDPAVRAQRLALLAEQLVRRGSAELALSSFHQAVALAPDCVPARLGLGQCLLRRGELAEAETHFRHVLALMPDSADAALGVAHVQTRRGGDELKLAEEVLRNLSRKRPHDARVAYLLGVLAEKAGDANGALGNYKRAAELALSGQQESPVK